MNANKPTPAQPVQFKPTALELRRAAYDKLIASLAVPRHTSIAGPSIVKAKAATGVMGTI